jgi:hypothetical protein
MRTETKILSAAMYEFSETLQSNHGIANAAIIEAATRLDEQTIEIAQLRRAEDALKIAMQSLRQIAETPRNAGAKRNANATVKFLETQGLCA